MQHFKIRQASPADIPEIREIYAHYVLSSTISFELSVPDIDEMLARLEKIRAANCSYLVCEVENEVAGYAYCSPYRPREAYRFTIEASIYLSDRFKGMGIGKGLLEALIVHSKDQGFRQMVSVVTGDGDTSSYAFHLRNGFTHCGTLKDVGQKFGQTIDTHFFQRAL